jgi:hypothetical protein
MPDMVTEAEARAIIDRIFSDNDVVLEKDFPFLFRWAQDSLAFEVDGFNDSLQVGYEYVDPDGEFPSLSSSFQAAVDSAGNADGPYIKLVHPAFADGRQEEWFEMEIQAFIQKLKGMGII